MNQPSLDFTRPMLPPPFRETSLDAADAMADRAPILRARVLGVLATGDHTADEVAAKLGESVLAIRPRVTELAKAGRIADSEARRKSASGRNAIVWRLKEATNGNLT